MRINTVISQLNYASLVELPSLAAALGADRLNLIPIDENTDDLHCMSREQILDYNDRIAPSSKGFSPKPGLKYKTKSSL